MTSLNFERALPLVLKHEGGYVDHPEDPGGATNLGITIATFRRYINPKGTKDDLRKITRAEAAKVYRKQYWDAIKGDDLPSGVDYAVFDFAVNSGPSRAAKYLQNVLAVPEDGKIGPVTLKAAKVYRADQIIEELCADRMAFLQRLSTWKTFGRGWSTRVAGVRSEALAMASRPIPSTENRSLPTEPVVVHVDPNGEVKPGKSEPHVERNPWWLALYLAISAAIQRIRK